MTRMRGRGVTMNVGQGVKTIGGEINRRTGSSNSIMTIGNNTKTIGDGFKTIQGCTRTRGGGIARSVSQQRWYSGGAHTHGGPKAEGEGERESVLQTLLRWLAHLDPRTKKELRFDNFPKQPGHQLTLGTILAINVAVWVGWQVPGTL
jgi:hypothetical protein